MPATNNNTATPQAAPLLKFNFTSKNLASGNSNMEKINANTSGIIMFSAMTAIYPIAITDINIAAKRIENDDELLTNGIKD